MEHDALSSGSEPTASIDFLSLTIRWPGTRKSAPPLRIFSEALSDFFEKVGLRQVAKMAAPPPLSDDGASSHQLACKPGSVRRRFRRATAIPLGRPLPDASRYQPG